MVKISTFVLTVVLFATSALSLTIPPNARHHHRHHNDDSVAPVVAENFPPQTLAARDPGLFSIGLKLLTGGIKAGVKVAKSREGRKVIGKVAKSGSDKNKPTNARVQATVSRISNSIFKFLHLKAPSRT
ncbi:hypothetical protein BJ912DRAFT_1066314 [Pholiota molesta]|nr:hypothetical protein BJ912DRAFT_1066314 [Pholiota molesta]